MSVCTVTFVVEDKSVVMLKVRQGRDEGNAVLSGTDSSGFRMWWQAEARNHGTPSQTDTYTSHTGATIPVIIFVDYLLDLFRIKLNLRVYVSL